MFTITKRSAKDIALLIKGIDFAEFCNTHLDEYAKYLESIKDTDKDAVTELERIYKQKAVAV